MRIAITTAMFLAIVATHASAEIFDARVGQLQSRVDLDSLRSIRVQHQGRIATLDTFARAQMRRIFGKDQIEGIDPSVAYLELYFNSGHYFHAPMFAVAAGEFRNLLCEAMGESQRQLFLSHGKLSPAAMLDERWSTSLVKMGRADKQQMASPELVGSLAERLQSLSGEERFRLSAERLADAASAFISGKEFCVLPASGIWINADDILQSNDKSPQYAEITSLRDAWRSGESDAINRCAGQLLATQSRLMSTLGQNSSPAGLENFYNRIAGSLVPLIVLAVSAVLFLPGVFGLRWARLAGLVGFLAALIMLTGLFVVRWIVSGRGWLSPPMMNMYEGVFASVMLASLVALVMEIRNRGGFIGLAAALYGATAMLACRWMDWGISVQHGILNSPIMGAHVAVIIVGHALAAMTLFVSLIYLSARIYRSLSGGFNADDSFCLRVDKCNCLLASLALITITVGTMLGSYWGDIAWGRWWGWDPKETWALMTILVYLWIIHVRRMTRPDVAALCTAIACVFAAVVMLFNWIVVNFFLAGMHSYA